jgi:hypothetical protein
MDENKARPEAITTFNITSRVSRRKFIFKLAGPGGVTLPDESVAYTIVAPPTWAETKGKCNLSSHVSDHKSTRTSPESASSRPKGNVNVNICTSPEYSR